jgi:hypothetical protein
MGFLGPMILLGGTWSFTAFYVRNLHASVKQEDKS